MLLSTMQLAYRAGMERAFQYDTERIDYETVLERHEAEDLTLLTEKTQPLQRYMYDCGRGQGSVMARNLEAAQAEALADCGRNDPPQNIRLATDDEAAFRKAMGGD